MSGCRLEVDSSLWLPTQTNPPAFKLELWEIPTNRSVSRVFRGEKRLKEKHS
jgi:hypothetical protein